MQARVRANAVTWAEEKGSAKASSFSPVPEKTEYPHKNFESAGLKQEPSTNKQTALSIGLDEKSERMLVSDITEDTVVFSKRINHISLEQIKTWAEVSNKKALIVRLEVLKSIV